MRYHLRKSCKLVASDHMNAPRLYMSSFSSSSSSSSPSPTSSVMSADYMPDSSKAFAQQLCFEELGGDELSDNSICESNQTLIAMDKSNNDTLTHHSPVGLTLESNWFRQQTTDSSAHVTTRSQSRNQDVEFYTKVAETNLSHKSQYTAASLSISSMSPISSGSTASQIATRSSRLAAQTAQARPASRARPGQLGLENYTVANKDANTPTVAKPVLIGVNKRLVLDPLAVEANTATGRTRKANDSPADLKQPTSQIVTRQSSRNKTTQAATTATKLPKKKRNSTTAQELHVAHNEDNDYDEDSSDDRSSNQILKLAACLTGDQAAVSLSARASRVVSFQISTNVHEPTGKRTGRTPPHKRFRKLRLFDTPHTPKTLIKKAHLVTDLAADLNSSQKPKSKKLLTAQDVIKAVVKSKPSPAPPVAPCTSLPASKPAKQMKTELVKPPVLPRPIPQPTPTPSQSLDFSPPHNQEFKSTLLFNEIQDNVHHTPKSFRRTPMLLLKAPVAVNPNEPASDERGSRSGSKSPQCNSCSMEIDTEPMSSTKKSLFKSVINSTTRLNLSAHSRRLFDHNGNNMSHTNNMNKKLQFDESDSEEMPTNRRIEVEEEIKYLFDNTVAVSMTNHNVSPVSSSSSWCSMPTNQQASQLTKLKSLSNSSNSLFKPISRFINQHYNTSSTQSFGYHSSNFCSTQALNSSGGSNGGCASTGSVANMRSPNSPFQFNQLHANINPFTPTNSFPNSNIITNQPTDLIGGVGFNREHKQSVKRCFNQTIINPGGEAGSHESDLEPVYEPAVQELYHCEQQQANSSLNEQSLPKNKRLALRQCLVSRYHEEFHEVCKLGSGEFGDVFKCINRLDGCTYAIKRSKKPIAGSALEIAAWKEVCAHAVLVKHNHIVQYYSAWAEADRMLIQNEYCNGGSLAEFIETLKLNNNSTNPDGKALANTRSFMNEYDLKLLLLHIAKGLAYMHSLNLVHLDIKPGNIFICRSPRRHHHHHSEHVDSSSQSLNNNGVIINEESGIESEELDDDDDTCALTISNKTKQSVNNAGGQLLGDSHGDAVNTNFSIFPDMITYKIGDLGHVTSTLDPHVEEGDCRYLPNEILQEQYDQLFKADVFALALTVFVCGSLEELPKNGDEWHWIRQGNLKDLPQCNDKFKKLLTQMVSENPISRPSASTLIHHPCIVPDASKSKSQLRKELNQEKFKNEMLKRKVKKYEQQLSNSGNIGLKPNDSTAASSSSQTFNKFSRSLSSTLL